MLLLVVVLLLGARAVLLLARMLVLRAGAHCGESSANVSGVQTHHAAAVALNSGW